MEAVKKESKIKTFINGVQSEWKKIVWPTKNKLVKQTAAVAAVSAILGALISIIDHMMETGLNFLMGL